jgi:hypothetical protein
MWPLLNKIPRGKTTACVGDGSGNLCILGLYRWQEVITGTANTVSSARTTDFSAPLSRLHFREIPEID